MISPATLRRYVQNITDPQEALEIAIEAFEHISAQDKEIKTKIGRAKLSPQQALIFALLESRMGQYTSNDKILNMLSAGLQDATPTKASVRTQIHRMRRKLADYYEINIGSHDGYVMKSLDDGVAEMSDSEKFTDEQLKRVLSFIDAIKPITQELLKQESKPEPSETGAVLVDIQREGRMNVFVFVRNGATFKIETMGLMEDQPDLWRKLAGIEKKA